jgi:XTP/dITP diphosphohydrolase
LSGRPRLVVATANPGKVREIRALRAGFAAEVRGLGAADAVAFPEEGTDYRVNAVAKARAAAGALGVAALADDSGLEVDALAGAPGPLSARYGGEGLGDAERVARLLAELAACVPGARGARFVCEVALATPAGGVDVARGVLEGRIAEAPRGAGGFGYDPVFVPEGGGGLTLAEIPAEAKNRISHRARALAALAPALERWRLGGQNAAKRS